MKLFISDLDDTLLPKNKKAIDISILNWIEKIVKDGNAFCVASGRSYVQLKKLFSELKVPIYYICCDGALCIYNEETLFSKPVALPEISSGLTICYSKYLVYADMSNLPFYKKAGAEFSGHILPLCNLCEPIFKVTVKNGAIRNYDSLSRVYHKNGWQEYVAKGINKGVSVDFLQKHLKISKSDTFIFGDGENDVSMTSFGKSFLIGNGFFNSDKYFDVKFPDFQSAIKEL